MTSDNIAQVAIPLIGLGIDVRSHYIMKSNKKKPETIKETKGLTSMNKYLNMYFQKN